MKKTLKQFNLADDVCIAVDFFADVQKQFQTMQTSIEDTGIQVKLKIKSTNIPSELCTLYEIVAIYEHDTDLAMLEIIT